MAEVTRGATSGRATLRDVAERAGVSPQTVSNYLNGRHVTRPATRERVDRAIRELGYRPNAAARALRSQRARAIAFVFEDPNDLGLHDPLHMEFLHGVAAAAHELDYHLTISRTAPGETVPAALRLVREGRADGLVLRLGGLDADRDPIRALIDERVPVVLLQQWVNVRGVFTVSAQEETGAEQAAEHLVGARPPGAGVGLRQAPVARSGSPPRRLRPRGQGEGRARAEWTCEAYTVRARARARGAGSWRPTTARPGCWRRTT